MKTFLISLILFVAGTASAQVTQPSYVRPSKGAPITIVPSVTASSVIATYTTSAIFDWSAFAGVVVTVNQPTGIGTFSACRYGVNVKALGNTSTAVSDFFLLNVANNDYSANVAQSWYVRVLPGYLRFAVGTYEAVPSGSTSCAYKVTITPLPFDYSGELVSTGVTSYIAAPEAFFAVNFTANRPYTRIQAIGDDVVYCTPVAENGSYPPAPADWPIRLNSAVNSRPAWPSVIEINNWVGVMQCVGQIGVFQH